jgi:hypothetical protein
MAAISSADNPLFVWPVEFDFLEGFFATFLVVLLTGFTRISLYLNYSNMTCLVGSILAPNGNTSERQIKKIMAGLR